MNEMEMENMAIEAIEPEVVDEDYDYDYEGDYKEESHTARNIGVGILLAAGAYGAYRGIRYLWNKRKAKASKMETPPQIMDMDSPTLTIGENEPIDIEKRIELDLEEPEETK